MRLRKNLVVVGLLFGVIISMGVVSSTSMAVSSERQTRSQHITMSPASTEISVDPGGTYRGKALLVNQGDDTFSANLSVTAYQTKGLTYNPVFKPIKGAPDITKWITIEGDTEIKEIKPHKSRDINYRIDVPEGTPPGGYYAVLFGTSSPADTENQGVIRRNRVGNILYITVNGDLKRSGSLTARAITSLSFDGTVQIPAVVKNTGSVHFTTDYEVSVSSLFGKQVFSKKSSVYILPQTERAVSATWQTNSPIGLYKITRSATVPSGKKILADAWVLVVNPLVIIGTLLILIAIVLAVTTRRKKHTEVE